MVPLLFLLAGACVLVEAFFSGFETAVISSSRLLLKSMADQGNARARLAVGVLERPERLLATTLVGTNLAVVIGTTLTTLAMGEMLPPKWQSAATVLIMTPAVLIFGELVPKAFCRAKADQMTLWGVAPLLISQKLMLPLVAVVTLIAHGLIRLTGSSKEDADAYAKRQELKILAELGEREGFLAEEQKKMIHGALDLELTPVRVAMIPLVDMVTIEEGSTVSNLAALAARTGFSRFPVHRNRVDDVVGIVSLTDVIYDETFHGRSLMSEVGSLSIDPFVRTDIVYVPESKSVGSLLHDLMESEIPMAIAVDEHGGVVGLATSEDLIEEVVGEIRDERDQEETTLQLGEAGVFTCEGSMELDELEEKEGITVKKEGFETVAGLVLKLAGKIPLPGEVYEWESYRIEILDATKRRVNRVRFTRVP